MLFRSKPHGGRRIVLATNVAETSLTVPGIRYVVDTGHARVKRYSYRNKVEQLQVEKVSQAAAKQRAGRCGRVAAGVCIRLYGEDDYQARPEFTDPEILRCSLAAAAAWARRRSSTSACRARVRSSTRSSMRARRPVKASSRVASSMLPAIAGSEIGRAHV